MIWSFDTVVDILVDTVVARVVARVVATASFTALADGRLYRADSHNAFLLIKNND